MIKIKDDESDDIVSIYRAVGLDEFLFKSGTVIIQEQNLHDFNGAVLTIIHKL